MPGRYTLQAYRDGVLTTLPAAASELATEAAWVLASAQPAVAATRAATAGRAGAEALAVYLDDYARNWSDFVDDLRLKRAAGGDAIRQAQLLAEHDGPLAALVQTVAQQTSLHQASAASSLGDALAPLERLVEDRFAALRELTLAGADGRRPLDAVLADFNELHVLRARRGNVARTPRPHSGRFTALARTGPLDAAGARRLADPGGV